MVFGVPGAVVGAGNEALGAPVLALYLGVHIPFGIVYAFAIVGFWREFFLAVLELLAADKPFGGFSVSAHEIQHFQRIIGHFSFVGRALRRSGMCSRRGAGCGGRGIGQLQCRLLPVADKPNDAKQQAYDD